MERGRKDEKCEVKWYFGGLRIERMRDGGIGHAGWGLTKLGNTVDQE